MRSLEKRTQEEVQARTDHLKITTYAHNIVGKAIKSGELVRPAVCSRCNENPDRIEGHHTDYDKPLEVEWLCRKCHKQAHREERQRARESQQANAA